MILNAWSSEGSHLKHPAKQGPQAKQQGAYAKRRLKQAVHVTWALNLAFSVEAAMAERETCQAR